MSFQGIKDWASDVQNTIMGWMGLLPENSKIIFLGLDNAGKTTLMQVMAEDRLKVSMPTLHPTANELTFAGNRKFKAFDMGGHQTARLLWKDYMSGVDAIVFIVDAADRTRFEEAKIELHRVFKMEGLRDVPFVILGNKIDKPTASSEEEFRQALGLNPSNSTLTLGEVNQSIDKPSGFMNTFTSGVGSVFSAVGLGEDQKKEITFNRDPETGALYGVFMCSIAMQMGYKDGFDWGIDLINIREKSESKSLTAIGGNQTFGAQPQQNYAVGPQGSGPVFGNGPQNVPQQQQYNQGYDQQQQYHQQQQQYHQQGQYNQHYQGQSGY